MDKCKKLRLAFYIIPIAVFLGIMTYMTVRFGAQLTALAREPEELRNILNSYGWLGVLVFMGIQMLQVLVAAIPGELVQLAGGYIYGTWLGTLYSLTGIVLGSVMVFFIARLLGYPLVKLLVSKKHLESFNFIINSNKSETVMFILFLIPGAPKDILTYLAAITPVKPLKFFAIITMGRLPALLASSYIGSSAQKGNYFIAVTLSAAAVILFAAGVFFKNKIINRVHRIS